MTRPHKGTKQHIHTRMALGVIGELRLLTERYQNYPGITRDLRMYLEIAEERDDAVHVRSQDSQLTTAGDVPLS